jgi:SAM-dependent methyltransferase
MLTQKIFHAICRKKYLVDSYGHYFQEGLDEIEEFLNVRFEGRIDFKGKTVLDVGCGFGSAVIYASKKGALKAVGIDREEKRISFAKALVSNEYNNLSPSIEFQLKDEIGTWLDDNRFDIIISKDSFEHYLDPVTMIGDMKRKLKKDGMIVVGFGPLWKAPYGGHILFMTKMPWAHLLFPESVVMTELKQFLHDDNVVSFEHVAGGLNKMTLNRFLTIVNQSGLEFEYFKVNLSPTRLMALFNILRRIPFCKEYFTQNVYCILRCIEREKPTKNYGLA